MQIDYYLGLTSPFTYLGHARFEELARRHNTAVHYRPIRVHEIFAVSGGVPVGQRSPQRQAYRLMELRRWRDFLGLPLNLEPRHFPVPDAGAARMVIAAGQSGAHPAALILGYLRAVWAEERDISDAETIRAVAAENGYDADGLTRAAAGEAAEAEYDANTKQAIERRVFGVPTWSIGEELYWGQDRIAFVERRLQSG